MQIEIGQYKTIDKGPLKASFSVLIDGQKILDCKYFVSGDKRWFNFPQKEVRKEGQEKPDYIPLISYVDKDRGAAIKNAILDALKTAGDNGTQIHANTKQSGTFSNKPPADTENLPF